MRRCFALMLIFGWLMGLAWCPAGEVWADGPKRPAAKKQDGREKTLRAVYPRAPRNLDPHGPPDPAAWPVIMAAYHRLVTFETGTARPLPALAKSVVISPDGLKYTFVLNEGLTFADGAVLNSEAALYSFNRLMLSEVGRRYYPYLSRFEVVGPYTFRLILTRPWPPFLASLGLPPASLISPGLAQRSPDYLQRRTLGSGPYQVYDWQGDTLGLQARPDLKTAPPISFVMFHYEPDPQKRLEKTLAHQGHLAVEPARPAGDLPGRYQFIEAPTFEVRYLAFNTRRPYTGQANIRRALSAVVGAAFADRPGRLDGPFPEGLFPGRPNRSEPPPLAGADPLTQAHYVLSGAERPLTPLVLAYQAEAGRETAAEAQLIAEALAPYGLTTEVRSLAGPEGRRALEAGSYDLYLGARAPDIPSADMWLGRFLDSSSTVDGNPAFFRHDRADRLIAEIVDTVGRPGDGPADYRQLEADRAAKVAQLAELAWSEAPYAFLYQLRRTLLVDVRLADLRPHPLWPEVWPLDQTSLKPFSFKSGANPTGRPPGQPADPGLPAVNVPGAPNVPSPRAPAPVVSQTPAPPPPAAAEPQPAPKPEEVLDYFDLGPAEEGPVSRAPNPRPDYDDFLGADLSAPE